MEQMEEKLGKLSTKLVQFEACLKSLKELSVIYNKEEYSKTLETAIKKALNEEDKNKHISEIALYSKITLFAMPFFFIVIIALLIWLAK